MAFETYTPCMLHKHEPGQPESQTFRKSLGIWWASWLLTFEKTGGTHAMRATSSSCTQTKPMSHMAWQLQETNFLTLPNPQTFANRIANLRKPLVKQQKSTMSMFPNLPKPSHKPSRFSTSPKGNAQNGGAACALFKILKKKLRL